ncbi:MAG: hypothetical protein ACTSWL_00770 [Promethearchaeota archaeon]
MIKQSPKIPILYLPVEYPVYFESLILVANRNQLKIEFFPLHSDFKINNIVQINEEVGFLFLHWNFLPKSMAELVDFKINLEFFFDYFEHPFIIFQGFQIFHKKIDPQLAMAIRGLLLHFTLKENIGVLPTRDINDTALVLRSLARRIQIKDKPPIISRTKPKLPTIKDHQEFLLEGLIDVGPQKAKILFENFHTPLEIFKAIELTEVCYTKGNKPKGINGPMQIQGFSEKFIQNNKKLLFEEFSPE